MRLNKYLAAAGVASRRKCDELIASGKVRINGETGVLGSDVSEDDVVFCEGKRVQITHKKYFLLNKPSGYICSCNDEKNRRSVLELLPNDVRLFPVGRLDYNTEGLLILTNDGDTANKLMHPRHKVLKEYYAEVEGKVLPSDIQLLREGVRLDDGFTTSKAKVELKSSGKISRLYITIGEGKNRQVRRMLEALGFQVLYLCRTKIGEIVLQDLALGSYRELTLDEISYINQL